MLTEISEDTRYFDMLWEEIGHPQFIPIYRTINSSVQTVIWSNVGTVILRTVLDELRNIRA